MSTDAHRVFAGRQIASPGKRHQQTHRLGSHPCLCVFCRRKEERMVNLCEQSV